LYSLRFNPVAPAHARTHRAAAAAWSIYSGRMLPRRTLEAEKEPVMTIRKLEKQEWHPFLDTISKLLEGKQAEIEVASLDLGDQDLAEWLPLRGITYDPNDDIVEVALDGLDHMIRQPREIYLDDGASALTSIEIVDAKGVNQIVKLRDQLALPSPP
jgi:hypothetical protein